jgi:hypothetical protein
MKWFAAICAIVISLQEERTEDATVTHGHTHNTPAKPELCSTQSLGIILQQTYSITICPTQGSGLSFEQNKALL